jgi:transcriptional regulator with XRE-family HTH domain
MAENTQLRASQVFGKRLKDLRRHRDMTQAQLAALMSELGFDKMSKTTLVRIERGEGERGLSLDEALGFAAALGAQPAFMLTPREGVEVALTSKHRTDASRIRGWLLTGSQFREPDDDTRWLGRPGAAKREQFERQMAHYAETLLDATRGKDKAGVDDALTAMVRELDRYRKESESNAG